MQIIIGLEERVGKFGKGNRRLLFQTVAHGVLFYHRIDREVLADIAQKGKQCQFRKPLCVVLFNKVRRAKYATYLRRHRNGISGDSRFIKQIALFALAAWVPDHPRASAREDDDPMPVFEKSAQDKEPHQIADVE